jgi:hypothetical protein
MIGPLEAAGVEFTNGDQPGRRFVPALLHVGYSRIPYRGEHRKAAKRAAADIERHSAAAKFSEPGRLRRVSMSVRLK